MITFRHFVINRTIFQQKTVEIYMYRKAYVRYYKYEKKNYK